MVSKVSSLSLAETPPNFHANPSGTREEYLILPGGSMDARWWVLHTETLLKNRDWRVRTTDLDNAPQGREVHWSSSLIWLLAGLSSLLSLFSGQSAHIMVAEAAMIVGPIMLFGSLALISLLLIRRMGWMECLFCSVVILGSHPIFVNFQSGEADHHGLVILCGFGCLLCFWLGVWGHFPSPSKTSKNHPPLNDNNRKLITLSAVCAAAALWISAATAIPILVGTALGGLLCAIFGGAGKTPTPDVWRHWGRVGCLASLGFYLLEYFPFHMGWRLEVNHPLYSISWLAGGYSLAMITEAIHKRKFPERKRLLSLVVLTAAASLPLLLILLFREDVFWVADSFLLNLHKSYIFEFQSLPSLVERYGNDWTFLTHYSWPLFVCLAIGVVAASKALIADPLKSVLFLLPPALVMQALAIYQIRWTSAAFALWAVLALVVFYYALRLGGEFPVWRWIYRAALATCLISLFVSQIPQLVTTSREEQTCVTGKINQENGNGILLRDIAHRLIQSSPKKTPVVLTGPNSSTDLAYHGRIKTLGTLYWENTPGLKSAARLFASQSEEETLAAILSAGITHIVVPSWDNFTEAYNILLGKESTPIEPYLNLVFTGKAWPHWLRPFAYPIPGDSGLDSNAVKIFAVLPEQGQLEAVFHRGVYHFDSGELENARKLFAEVVREIPDHGPSLEYLAQIQALTSADRAESASPTLP